ncbi:YbbR-like domain-containing protein [Cohnella thermotolerans]|uniref:CdaR family protein n=1 Tax=Cohnella thermotolerans TaxID=329858 RepID=UPI000406D6F6|nr:CdaR family protein [Cohnella thermotolerans]
MDKWLSHPTAMKLIALVLGIILWAVVHFDDTQPSATVPSTLETKTINSLRVQAYGLNERSYVLESVEPQSVKLVVRGTRSDLLKASTDDYSVRVDLSTVTEGEHTLKLQAELPRGVDLVSMTPDSVKVTVEELQTKEFEVEIATKGTPAQGYKAGIPVLRPSNRVHVTLPSGELAKVERVGGTVSVEGASKTIKSKSVRLAAYDADGNVIEGAVLDPAVLEVDVPITNPYKTVPLQFKLLGHMPAGLSIAYFKPDAEKVTIYGPQDVLDKIEFVEADLQLNNLTKSGRVSIKLQGLDSVTEYSPATVNVDIEVVLSQTRSIQGLPVTIEGLGEGLHAKITDPSTEKVDITVQGAPAMLDTLKPGDVDVVADLSGRGPGVYTVPIVVNSPRFIDQVGGNKTITVEITSDQPASASPAEGTGASDDSAAAASGTSGSGTGADSGSAGAEDGSQESQPPAEG